MLKSTSQKPKEIIDFDFFGLFLSRRWIFSTIIVILAMIVMIRLGIWQLDRLEQRRTFNNRVLSQLNQPAIELDDNLPVDELGSMEYREITTSGNYDHSQEIALLNQYEENQWGVHLITPLLLTESQSAILVDRGWIPAEKYQTGVWGEFAEPGLVQVKGIIRLPQNNADFGRRKDILPTGDEKLLRTWNFVNIELLQKQIPYPLLSVYIQQSPDSSLEKLPKRTTPDLDLTEGPHLGYAIQWLVFAVILGSGYIFYIRRYKND